MLIYSTTVTETTTHELEHLVSHFFSLLSPYFSGNRYRLFKLFVRVTTTKHLHEHPSFVQLNLDKLFHHHASLYKKKVQYVHEHENELFISTYNALLNYYTVTQKVSTSLEALQPYFQGMLAKHRYEALFSQGVPSFLEALRAVSPDELNRQFVLKPVPSFLPSFVVSVPACKPAMAQEQLPVENNIVSVPVTQMESDKPMAAKAQQVSRASVLLFSHQLPELTATSIRPSLAIGAA